MNRRAWQRLITVLAADVELCGRLLSAHVDVGGRCRACTTPGTGTPGARWPCVIERAANAAALRGARALTATDGTAMEEQVRVTTIKVVAA